MIPASRFKRFVAYVIDHIIDISACYVLGILFGITFVLITGISELSSLSLGCLQVLAIIVIALYYALFESSKYQGTPGKKLLGLYVSNSTNERISFFRALNRIFLLILTATPTLMKEFHLIDMQHPNIISVFLFLVLWVPVYFTKERITFYDMLTSTRVYAKPKNKSIYNS